MIWRRWSVVALAIVSFGACGGGGVGSGSCDIEGGGRCRPERERVDRATPTFSNPTAITNPLLPVASIAQAVQRGTSGGRRERVEVTRLGRHRTVAWNGRHVDTVATQFASFVDGRIDEVAVDYTAQADDGSVWYFGEDVDNYKDGKVSSREGSWLAGRDGPPGMLMPAHPKVGDVFRPENIPGKVFEEDTVMATGVTAAGPRGPVPGSVRIREHLRENETEDKTYGPGYGEMIVGAEDEKTALTVAVPTDAATPPAPSSVREDLRQTREALSAAGRGRRDDRSHAIEAALAATDAELPYGPVAGVDVDRMDVWRRAMVVDVVAGDRAAVVGDLASVETVRDRVVGVLDAGAVGRLDAAVGEVRKAVGGGELSDVVGAAERLRTVVGGLTGSG